MSNDTHLDELGGDLDQALRSAVMAASQMGENLALGGRITVGDHRPQSRGRANLDRGPFHPPFRCHA